jgi:hypothetical protein
LQSGESSVLGVIAKPKKTAILEAVRSARELANAYKSITLPGCPRKSIAQKESVLGDPFEGGGAQTRRAIMACRCRLNNVRNWRCRAMWYTRRNFDTISTL